MWAVPAITSSYVRFLVSFGLHQQSVMQWKKVTTTKLCLCAHTCVADGSGVQCRSCQQHRVS